MQQENALDQWKQDQSSDNNYTNIEKSENLKKENSYRVKSYHNFHICRLLVIIILELIIFALA